MGVGNTDALLSLVYQEDSARAAARPETARPLHREGGARGRRVKGEGIRGGQHQQAEREACSTAERG